MPRLVDYVVLVGYNFDKATGTESEGRIIHRFPTKSWSDYPFDFRLESFCQPWGWHLETSRPPPMFFVAYLTDMEGDSYFAACLTFHEAVTTQQLSQCDRDVLTTGIQSGARVAGGLMNGGTHFLHPYHWRPSPTASSVHSSESLASSDMGLFIPPNHANSHLPQPSGFSDHGDPNLVRPAEWFAPKCLVLLARHQHFDVLKNSLSLLYTVFADSLHQYSLEQMIASLLGSVDVPPTGGPRITFSLGAGDRQVIQPARCDTIPVTRNCVALLFKNLGIHNVILLFSAILSDQKVLLCSRSLNRLTESCQALTAILYPLKYGHTFVPILPKCLIEYLNAPTPFLYGIHTSYRSMLPELVDVFIADLDGGSVTCPENIPVPQLPEPYFEQVVESLFQILSPELLTADHVYPPKPTAPSADLIHQDKQLRAVFLRLFASLFSGYRSCLNITRIHPQPVIHFDQSLFVMLRKISSQNEFFERLLSSMRFHQFVLERGPPFRVCDLFDEVYDTALPPHRRSIVELSPVDDLHSSPLSSQSLSQNDRLSQKLLENECGDKPVEHILPNEAVEAHKRLHQTPFPKLDSRLIDQLTSEACQKKSVKKVQNHKPEPRFVPQGLLLDRQLFKAIMYPDKNRVIREFIADIFDQHITEALKRRNTIRQDLKSRPIRRLFVDELQRYVVPSASVSMNDAINDLSNSASLNCSSGRNEHDQRAVLTWEQFQLIVDLLDEALCQESQSEDCGIAAIVMDLSTRFTTQINHVRYYANMTQQIQRHAVWEQMSFWENVFNEHVNNQIRQLYLHFAEQEHHAQKSLSEQPAMAPLSRPDFRQVSPHAVDRRPRQGSGSPYPGMSNGERVSTIGLRRNSLPCVLPQSAIQRPAYTTAMSALEIAAEEMRLGGSRSKEIQTTLELQEESTVYAQIIHFINLIVNFRVPLDVAASAAAVYGELGDGPNEYHADTPVNLIETTFNGPSRTHARENGLGQTDRYDSLNPEKLGSPSEHRQTPNRAQGSSLNAALEHISRLEAWLRRFVEKVTDENNLTSDRILKINEKIEGIIEGHLLNLETIYPEVKSIPKAKKPEIVSPTLLDCEVPIAIAGNECVRCQLLVDGRLERTDWQWLDTDGDLHNSGQSSSLSDRPSVGSSADTEVELDAMLRPLLPAQGALFVTNYRVIFTGVPKDPYQSNKVITRSFPVASLYSIKKMGLMRITTIFPATSAQQNPCVPPHKSGKRARAPNSHGHSSGTRRRLGRGSHHGSGLEGMGGRGGLVRIDENLEVLHIRAVTMQLLKLGFDPDEVSQDMRDELRNLLTELRYPTSLQMGFNSPPPGVTVWNVHGFDSDLSTSGSASLRNRSAISDPRLKPPPSSLNRPRGSSLIADEPGHTIAPLASLTNEFLNSDETVAVISPTILDRVDWRLRSIIIHSPGYLDMARFALNQHDTAFHSRSGTSIRSSAPADMLSLGVQLTSGNVRYELTGSYPALILIPQSITQVCLTKVARAYHHGRFPVVTWQHPVTGAYLLRGGGFNSKSIIGALKHVGSSGPAANLTTDRDGSEESTEQTGGSTSTGWEHARYLLALIDMSFSAMTASGLYLSQSAKSVVRTDGPPSAMHTSAISPAAETPVTRDRRLLGGLRTGGGKTRSLYSICSVGSALGRLAGLTLRHGRRGPTPMGSVASGLEDDLISTISDSNTNLRGLSTLISGRFPGNAAATMSHRSVTLCVLGEKSLMKTLSKQSHVRSVEFIGVEFFTHSNIAESFKSVIKACMPKDGGKSSAQSNVLAAAVNAAGLSPVASNTQNTISEGESNAWGSGGFAATSQPTSSSTTVHTAIHDSGWLAQLQSLLQLAGAVVDLLDLHATSVAVCLEDGMDAVTQTVCLAQVMLDPHYRTLSGFWSLVEKEWILFGHRFNQRLHQTATTKSDQISPVFLQFLDAVHQLARQFPVSFEFNDFFLQFLAYHHFSNRFHDFKYDCEKDRFSAWFGVSDGLRSASRIGMRKDSRVLESFDSHSIWSYIQKQHEEWPVFFNFRYSRELGQKVLRPATNMASLDVWKFYLTEDLATGPVYDLDHFSPSYRKQNNRPYDPVLRQGLNNTHVEQVYALLGLREGEEATGWKATWDQAQSEFIGRPRKTVARARPFRRSQPIQVDRRARVADAVKLRDCTEHLTITTDYREASEPLYSSASSETNRMPLPPRRAVSESFTELNQRAKPTSGSFSNHTTVTPQDNVLTQMDENEDMVSASSNVTDTLHSTELYTEKLLERTELNGVNQRNTHRPSSDLSDISAGRHKVATNTLLIEPYSEDEAFHEGTGASIGDDDDDRSLNGGDSSDECLAARSAAFDYHRAATLQRLTRRTTRNVFADGGLSHPSVETGLGYESDSLHSGSAVSNQVGNSMASADEAHLSSVMFAMPHHFNSTSVSMSNARCHYCQTFLLSLSTGRQAACCANCGILCHEKCAPFVSKTCRSLPHTPGMADGTMRPSVKLDTDEHPAHKLGTILSPNLPWRNDRTAPRTSSDLPATKRPNLYPKEMRVKPGNLSPTRRLEALHAMTGTRVFQEKLQNMKSRLPIHLSDASFYGWLYKMGHRRVLQQWKKRFFVLNTDRHQLMYYDTSADEVVRGCVDLQEVRAVRIIKNFVPHQLRGVDCAVFELETNSRTYRFAAESAAQANEWIERIQNTIQ
ncbi:hypothetical protein CRM22_010521 [Opisthorchis felineus]|uniref:UDENN domain-containing protein n=1 Tax=Opisthorchis felineus TaxID=147828 RepID=A0A4S2L3H1_OPIFE|nr:hypothetical protein CRM22_010521 [Opisthorchis felineus]